MSLSIDTGLLSCDAHLPRGPIIRVVDFLIARRHDLIIAYKPTFLPILCAGQFFIQQFSNWCDILLQNILFVAIRQKDNSTHFKITSPMQWRSQDFGLGGANVSTALYDLVI